jgi:hypothetical protein
LIGINLDTREFIVVAARKLLDAPAVIVRSARRSLTDPDRFRKMQLGRGRYGEPTDGKALLSSSVGRADVLPAIKDALTNTSLEPSSNRLSAEQATPISR